MGGNSFAFVPLPPIVIAMGHSEKRVILAGKLRMTMRLRVESCQLTTLLQLGIIKSFLEG